MGNACCQQPIKLDEQQLDHAPVFVNLHESPVKNSEPPAEIKLEQSLPELDPRIIKRLQEKNCFEKEIQSRKHNFKVKHYKNEETYEGELSQSGKPNGLGKLYRKDGSFIIGHFREGVLEGHAVYVSKEGLFCEGNVSQGKMNCEDGTLQTVNFKYRGGFRDNLFDGKGVEASDGAKFEGQYKNGNKIKGKLSWLAGQYIYEYEGTFDAQERFHGKGRLTEPFGEYTGQFKNGEKHGQGRYRFTSELSYEGEYREGKRSGKGKLINKDKTISYEGEFQNGLPNGEGKSYKDGKVVQSGKFIDGIFQESL